ncbi:CENP-S associating centromere protein X-domain-containing protein [Nemania sp. FL0031]|nr:CENP-S associating centromere protein X-domain-containing protein [Nemania sp. FL0031]
MAASRAPRGGSRSTAKTAKTTKFASSRSKPSTSRSSKIGRANKSDDDPFADDDPPRRPTGDDIDIDREDEAERIGEGGDDDNDDPSKTIPPDLLTRILHEFFEKDGTRISKDANQAVAKYMDIFVREAIARTAVEKGNGFLEVEDLEKVAPQLLMDL